jgi:hypothetical protein
MKDTIFYIIDKIFNNVDGCLVLMACFCLFILLPIIVGLLMFIK